MPTLALLGLSLLAATGAPPVRAGEAPEWRAHAPLRQVAEPTDRLIVRYRDGADATRRGALGAGAPRVSAAAQQRLLAAGLQPLRSHRNGAGAQVVQLDRTVPAATLASLARQIAADDPDVLYAEPDHVMRAQATPTDPLYASQWHYFEATGGLGLPAAWDMTTGGGVVVAVLDTGVRPHADLAANLLQGADFVSGLATAADGDGRDTDASDPGDGCNGARSSWHGTHVAGTVAAVANNGVGGTGVAPGAKILPVRVLGCGGGYTSDIADAIVWATGSAVGSLAAPAQPARVLNLSLGGRHACAATTQSAIDQARARGAVVIVAAGNNNQDASHFSPANCRGVITVGAVGRLGGKASYSNFGARVDVSAPGGDQATGAANGVLSTLNDGYSTPGTDSYAHYQGTSMATPHVAGVAALMLARNPALTVDEVKILLRSNTRALPRACPMGCGTGIVQAAATVGVVFVGSGPARAVAEAEPNNTRAAPQALSNFPLKVSGTMASTSDLDLYRVNVGRGQTVTARLMGNEGSNYDLEMHTIAATNSLLGRSNRAAGLTDRLSWTNTRASAIDVYLRVSRASGATGPAAAYTLEVVR